MKILALDLATTTGVAYGDSPSSLWVGHWNLRADHQDLVPGNLAYELRMLFRDHGPPDFMAIEATLAISGQKHAWTARSQERLHGAALGVAGMYRIPHVAEYAPSTIRKHFIGVANMGARAETKAAVMRRCRQLGYKVGSDDEGDAVALWDFIHHAVLKNPAGKFALFGG